MTIEQIKQKMITGDYITLGRMLGITPDSARMRFRRQKEDAIKAMQKIIIGREALISQSSESVQV